MGRCSSEPAQLVLFPYSYSRSAHYYDRLHDFSVTIPRCHKDVYVISLLAQIDPGILCSQNALF